MPSQYHVDLTQISLADFRRTLETGAVLPGRQILQEQIPARFAALEAAGITNLAELSDALKTKQRLAQFAQRSGLPIEYLTILRREVNSYTPKPFNLKDIPEVAPAYVEKLAAVGIKNTKHLFDRAATASDRAELAQQVDVPPAALLELVQMSDLARINGVGPVFARLLYEAHTPTVAQFATCAPKELLERVNEINAAKQYTRIMPVLKDLEYCVEIARGLPQVLE